MKTNNVFLIACGIRQKDHAKTREETRRIFSRLKGILLIDSLGNLDDYQDRIRAISDLTGLPILETRKVGLAGLQKVLSNALERVQP